MVCVDSRVEKGSDFFHVVSIIRAGAYELKL